MFLIVKAQDVRNFSHLCWWQVLALDGEHLNKCAMTAKLYVFGLLDDLLNIDGYLFFFSSAVTIYNVLF